MSTRDKLAQLLMVGVTGAADARAVVADHHVGGIMVGSWTDLSMLSDGSLARHRRLGRTAAARGERRRGGRPGVAAGGPDRKPAVAAGAGPDHTPDEVYGIALDRGRQMRALGITIDFAPVVDVTDAADDTVIGDRSFGSDPATVTDYAGAYARGLRDAGLLPVLKHFPGHGSRLGRFARRQRRHPAAEPTCRIRPGAVPDAGLRKRRSASWSGICRCPA